MPSVRTLPREISKKWFVGVQRDMAIELTKADCRLIQAHLRANLDTEAEDMKEEAEETLKMMLEEDLRFLSLFSYLGHRHLAFFAERRRPLYKKALEEDWVFNVLLTMRDSGNPLHLVDIHDV